LRQDLRGGQRRQAGNAVEHCDRHHMQQRAKGRLCIKGSVAGVIPYMVKIADGTDRAALYSAFGSRN
jgi:hypothetical protein